MQQVGIHGIRRTVSLIHLNRYALLRRISQQLLARCEIPDAPRRDHGDIGLQGVGAKLKAHLVVAFAGGAVSHSVCPAFGCDLNETLGDERAGDGCAQQVFALIQRIGSEHREDEIRCELFTQVVNVDFFHAHRLGFGAGRAEFFALADVGSESHHFAVVSLLQPAQDHGSVQPAGVGEDDFIDRVL